MVVDSAVSAAGDSDVRPLRFSANHWMADLLPDAFPDFLAVPRFVCVSDNVVSDLASDDCASEPGLALDFFADDLALPIT
jgi:hypothetical protein